MCKDGDGKVWLSHQLYKQHLSAAQVSSRQVSSLNLSIRESSRGAVLSPARTPRAVLLLNITSSFISAVPRTGLQQCEPVSLPSHGLGLDSCAEIMAKH